MLQTTHAYVKWPVKSIFAIAEPPATNLDELNGFLWYFFNKLYLISNTNKDKPSKFDPFHLSFHFTYIRSFQIFLKTLWEI